MVDGSVVTALPNASVEFAMTICELLDIYDADQAELIGDHLRGGFVAALYEGRK